jgi:hypothetical protein
MIGHKWALALALTACPLLKANHGTRVYFKGSDQLAAQSALVPPGAVPVAPVPVIAAPPMAPPPFMAGPRVAPSVVTPPLPEACAVPGGCLPNSGKANNYGAGTPNQVVTFLHPYTGKAISIPLTLPVGKPTVTVREDRVIYDYGFLKPRVVVRFFQDGQVMVRYGG